MRTDAPSKSEIPEGAILIIARPILCHRYKFQSTPRFLFNSHRIIYACAKCCPSFVC